LLSLICQYHAPEAVNLWPKHKTNHIFYIPYFTGKHASSAGISLRSPLQVIVQIGGRCGGINPGIRYILYAANFPVGSFRSRTRRCKDCKQFFIIFEERPAQVVQEPGAVQVNAITPQTEEDFQQKMLVTKCRAGKPFAPGTINLMVRVQRNACAAAVTSGLIPRNPVAGLPQLPEKNDRGKVISPTEFGRSLEQCLTATTMSRNRTSCWAPKR
jgi:hypothetical protein